MLIPQLKNLKGVVQKLRLFRVIPYPRMFLNVFMYFLSKKMETSSRKWRLLSLDRIYDVISSMSLYLHLPPQRSGFPSFCWPNIEQWVGMGGGALHFTPRYGGDFGAQFRALSWRERGLSRRGYYCQVLSCRRVITNLTRKSLLTCVRL